MGVDDNLLIGVGALILSVLTYFAGKREGARQTLDSREHAEDMEEDRRLHHLSTKVADVYVKWANRHHDSGPHALARLALHMLDSDQRIRDAIKQMHARSGGDPWSGHGSAVEDVDLVAFFQYVDANKVNFHKVSVETVVSEL